jgi:predicted porin
LALGYNYDLSKRTSLYGRITTLRNKGNASASLAGAGVTVAPNSGNSASLIGVGMIHRF